MIPVKVDGRDAEALVDSGSVVSLVQPHLLEPSRPVPVLVGRDCPLYYQLRQDNQRSLPRTKPGSKLKSCEKKPTLISTSHQDTPKVVCAALEERRDNPISNAEETLDNLVFPSGPETEGQRRDLLVIPKQYVSTVLHLAHSHVMGAHLGVEKTRQWIASRFHWPGVVRAVEDYCRTCIECQKMSPEPHFKSPLIPLPIIDVPFSRIAMDLVGPLAKSARGHQYILVILDYATRYPEAIPLRNMTTKRIARELIYLFSRVGIPKEMLTDQGTPFMSKVMKDLCRLFKVKQLRTSVYHPQTDGLVERFNKTLKSMLKKVVDKDGRNWDQLLPYVLFSIREVSQASTGFSPFELLYGRQPRGLLDIAKEAWEEQPSPHRSLVEHVEKMQAPMKDVWPMVRDHMAQAQEAQRRVYNRGAQPREFQPGDKVLVLIPTTNHKFLASWQGTYEVTEKVGPVNYKVYSEVTEVAYGPGLSQAQLQQTRELVQQNLDVFSTQPGRTSLVEHHINTEPGQKVKLRPYRIPEAKRAVIEQEVQKMLALGVIEESYSEWTSPGYTIGRDNVRPQDCKVQAIQGWPRPSTKAQVKTFLGLTSYYARFIPNFSAVASPLTDLTRASQPLRVKWTEEAEQAFQGLKGALSAQPVLVTPDFSREMIVQMNASMAGIGAVLSQEVQGEEHPIIYISRKLNTREQGYATVEKEALAIKWALERLRYYFWGRHFTLVTDHAPLVWMANKKDTNAKVGRWFISLQEFNFSIVHSSGAKHGNADALSRRDALWTMAAPSRPELKGGMCKGLRGRGGEQKARRSRGEQD
ncbi:uncharacterized protein LOC142940136 [Anarhichas minor]|uniref:uncharacterized protein LOC142940136 n=1 Tax=Anarhichas minor TaxID=65739 RepID=UPI003F735D11